MNRRTLYRLEASFDFVFFFSVFSSLSHSFIQMSHIQWNNKKHSLQNKLSLAWRNDDNVNRRIQTHSHDRTRNRFSTHQTIINNSPTKNVTNKEILKRRRSNSYGSQRSEKSSHTHSDRRGKGGRDLVEYCMASQMAFPPLSSWSCRYECLFVCLRCGCVRETQTQANFMYFFTLCVYFFGALARSVRTLCTSHPICSPQSNAQKETKTSYFKESHIDYDCGAHSSFKHTIRLHTCMLAGAVIKHVHTCLTELYFLLIFCVWVSLLAVAVLDSLSWCCFNCKLPL